MIFFKKSRGKKLKKLGLFDKIWFGFVNFVLEEKTDSEALNFKVLV